MSAAAPLLSVRGLSLAFATPRGAVQALRGIDLDVPADRIVGIVGESGSGKSTLGLAILGLLPANLARQVGRILFAGEDLAALPEERRRHLRGDRIAMIFQDPMTALNPVFTVGAQIGDVLRAKHPGLGRRERRRRAAEMLTRVGIPDAPRRLRAYPHQFSGGMRQRIMIAMALLAEPDLLIADEPTTALDVTIEAQIVRLIQALRGTFRGSILFISHSLGLISEIADEVVVMYAGTVVETAPAAALFASPRHPYTAALLACEVEGEAERGLRLRSIPGELPSLVDLPPGCIFAPRCPRAIPGCLDAPPPLRDLGEGRRAACILA